MVEAGSLPSHQHYRVPAPGKILTLRPFTRAILSGKNLFIFFNSSAFEFKNRRVNVKLERQSERDRRFVNAKVEKNKRKNKEREFRNRSISLLQYVLSLTLFHWLVVWIALHYLLSVFGF